MLASDFISSFSVTAERLVVHKHPDPTVERIELAQVGEYRAVIPKGRYKTGDWAIYIPEQAIVPDHLLAELGLTATQTSRSCPWDKRSRVLAEYQKVSLNLILPETLPESEIPRNTNVQIEDFRRSMALPTT